MEAGRWGCREELIAALSAATEVLEELPVSVSRLTGADLDAVLTVIDRLAAVAAAGRFTLAAEAEQRGEVAGSQAGSLRQWVTDRCPSLEPRDAGVVAKAVRELTVPALAPAKAAVAVARLSVAAGSSSRPSWRSWRRCCSSASRTRCWPGWSPWERAPGVPGCGRSGRRCWPGTAGVRS